MMKQKRQILALFLAVLLGASILLTACGREKVAYQVSITDAMGNPYTKGIAVKFMQDEEQAGIQAVDKNGVAGMLLPQDDYTAVLQFADPEAYVCNETDLTLSADKTQLTVIVNRSLSEKTETLFVGDAEYTAHFVDTGCTDFALQTDKMTYFLFEPAEAGQYEFSLLDSDAVIGCYGTPAFVLQESMVKVNSTISLSVSQEEVDGGAGPLVLGVATGEGRAVLAVSRVGDATQPEQMPWSTDWQTKHQQTEGCRAELPEKLRYFDITARSGKYNLFYDETTGYYRTKKNGPVVLVALGKNNNPKCPATGLYERVCGNGMYGGSDVVRYFSDESGKTVKREKYTDALLEIFEHSGITAYDQEVYHPLTQDLMYILQNGFADWWNPESPDYQEIFAKANSEYAWLFACCYER